MDNHHHGFPASVEGTVSMVLPRRVSMHATFSLSLLLLAVTAALSFATNGWALVQVHRGLVLATPAGLGLLVVRTALSGLALGLFIAVYMWMRAEIFRPLKHFEHAQTDLLAIAIEAASDAVVIFEGEPGSPEKSRIVYVNGAFERYTGYRRQDVLGLPPGFMIPLDEARAHAEVLGPLKEARRPVLAPAHFQRKDGTDCWLEISVVPFPHDGHWMAIGRDITERLKTERELAERNRQLLAERTLVKNLIEHVPVGIAALDRELRYVWVNDAYAALKAKPPAWFSGRDIFALWPRAREDFEAPMREVLDTGATLTLQAYQSPAYPQFFWDITGFPLYGEGDQPENLIVILQNVTERVEKQRMQQAQLRKLQELDRLKDHLLSNLSHELRTPLSLIVGYTELLEDKYPEEPLLAGILDGNRRLVEHLNSLLEYSALISGSLPLYLGEVCLEELMDHAIAIEQAAIAGRRIRVERGMDRALCLKGDARRLTQILVELISNAVRHTPDGGTIGIEGVLEGSEAHVTVWDTGPGLPPEEEDHIWEPFHPVGTEREPRGGLGLGLALVKRLAALHGGRVALENHPGEGCRFHVYLPLAGPPAP